MYRYVTTFVLRAPPENVDFLLKSLTDSQENDYDSVPSDEDTDQDLPSSKGDRTKVTSDTQDSLNPIFSPFHIETGV